MQPRTLLAALALAVVPFRMALALITGGQGNSPVIDPGWPQGAAAIFNHAARIAWWEGPPFGGGQWHAEYRGDAKTLSGVLADFARLNATTKRLVVHDGAGRSFWLNPNREPAKQAAAQMDWSFMVWQAANWERLRTLPADLNPTLGQDADKGPPAQIDIYTGGLRWFDVIVPTGLEIIDNRLEAHGFTLADGIVLEGKVVDLETGRPLAAKVQLQRVEPQPTGGYQYTVVAEAAADEQGGWVLKQAPAGRHRVVVYADGYVPRVAGYAQLDDQPRWHSYACGLSLPAPVTGHISDAAGKPLADVQVRLADVSSGKGGRYESTQEYVVKTGPDGNFRLDLVPIGSASIRLRKPGYVRPGLGHAISTPAKDVVLGMMQSARVRVTVDFGGAKPAGGYVVHMEPDGGEAVGKWSGSGNIDAQHQIVFDNVPPAVYVLYGRENPGSADQQSKRLTIDLKGGQTTEITLPSR